MANATANKKVTAANKGGTAAAPSAAGTAMKVSNAAVAQGRIDLAAALRWAARCGLNEGVCNHFSFELAPDRYLINPQGMHCKIPHHCLGRHRYRGQDRHSKAPS